MRHRRGLRIAIASALLFAGAACGSDGEPGASLTPSTIDPAAVTSTSISTATSTTATEPGAALPPVGAIELESYYGEQLAALGLRLVDRGGLIDRTDGGYQASAQGTHLALYVEPIDERTVAEYLDGIRTVTVIFAGDIFDRWPGLVSFDVCQEPAAAEDPRTEPLPVTQIEMTRDEAAAFDYDTVTTMDLVRASVADPPGLALRVSTRIATDPAYEALVAAA